MTLFFFSTPISPLNTFKHYIKPSTFQYSCRIFSLPDKKTFLFSLAFFYKYDILKYILTKAMKETSRTVTAFQRVSGR